MILEFVRKATGQVSATLDFSKGWVVVDTTVLLPGTYDLRWR